MSHHSHTAANPFVNIPPWMYLLFAIGFLFHQLLAPTLAAAEALPEYGYLISANLAAKYVFALLLALPLVFTYKYKGILNPLLFPIIFVTLKGLVTDGAALLEPFSGYQLYRTTNAFKMLSVSELITLDTKIAWTDSLATLCVYLGYFAIGEKRPGFRLRTIANFSDLKRRLIVAGLIGSVVVLAFFASQGGVLKYIGSWGISGRSNVYNDFGPIMVFFKTLIIIPTIWFLIEGKKAIRNPFFLFFCLLFLIVGFLGQGSRSSVFSAGLILGLAWLVKYQRIPKLLVAVAGVVAFVALGLLGNIRNSTWRNEGVVDTSIVTNFDVAKSVAATRDELASVWGKENPGVAIMYSVPKIHPHLYGKSYLAGIFFFVPRFIWKDKPHGVGYYVSRNIWRQNKGIPPGEVMEVYYNFSFLGVIFLFFFKGMLGRLFTNWYAATFPHPAGIALFIFFIMFGFSLAAITFVGFLQKSIFILLFYKFCRVL